MDTVGTNNNFAKQSQDLTDKAADKLQSGIRQAKDAGSQAADRLSDKVQAAASQTMDSLSAATKKVRANVADVGDSLVSYTKDNPVQAILISAVVGALLATVVKALMPDRD